MRISNGLRAAAGAGGGVAWDVSTAVYNGSPVGIFPVVTEDSSPNDLFFKGDGTKMYVVSLSNDSVYEYDLSTPWQISSANYLQSFSVAGQDTTPRSVFFKGDGTKMYILGDAGNDVNEYSLSTAWNITTASFVQNFSVSAQDATPEGIFFKSDGTEMFIVGSAIDTVYKYSLSTAWDIITANYVQSFSISAQDTSPTGIHFKDDGTKMYVLGDTGNDVNEYSLSTAWNITTASYVRRFIVANQETSPEGVFFKDDGSKMYIIGGASDSVHEYNLSTAWDVSTASYITPTSDYLSLSAQSAGMRGLFFKDDGTKMYLSETATTSVYEYNLSSAWDIFTATSLQSFNVGTNAPGCLGLHFKDDGTRMYVMDSSGDLVAQYNLSTAWDVSTAAFAQSFSVVLQDGSPQDIHFKDDGTKMYVVGATNKGVYEYSLSTAWDISTATYSQTFSVSGQGVGPCGLSFKDDGTKMYVSQDNNGSASAVYEYDLSTAWDISTAVYGRDLQTRSLVAIPEAIFFKDDGKKLYVVDGRANNLWSYDL